MASVARLRLLGRRARVGQGLNDGVIVFGLAAVPLAARWSAMVMR